MDDLNVVELRRKLKTREWYTKRKTEVQKHLQLWTVDNGYEESDSGSQIVEHSAAEHIESMSQSKSKLHTETAPHKSCRY